MHLLIATSIAVAIVTHHAFDYEWYGATGKIHNITNEVELIGKELLDGMMLNQALLNGEMAAYSSAQVGVEMLIRRLESWRNELADWVEKNVFLTRNCRNEEHGGNVEGVRNLGW